VDYAWVATPPGTIPKQKKWKAIAAAVGGGGTAAVLWGQVVMMRDIKRFW